ncbi:terminase large subunit [Melissococcus plutonius]|uniref:terminase large subunit n=9 Tax=Melissococcus plutonius TaxID=33970 RepID=UPI000669DE82|nr:terminase TerL endonuclease subunit [Melissococcus plutonius]KMT32961.1 phage terminase large subunit [Melissococcus plutonius]MCV2498220.1 terminase large subunit [Melissococcus plutonius]MCV2506835.1 terminase large subunit [Melissococcus plutonius]MCV2528082.1 terminase large subunit [Melissococcus plutonius]
MIDVFEEFNKLDKARIKKQFKDPGTAYCFAILNKKQIAGYMIKMACLRHLRDLQHSLDDESFKYNYNLKAVQSILSFAAICPNVDTQEPTKLMPWQEFILCQMFGWRDELGNKRFSRVLLSVARGQGKTYLCAIISCYSYLVECSNLSNQDLMVASNITEQAQKLYGYVKTMMQYLLDGPFKRLKNELEIEPQHNRIIQRKGANTLRQMSAESGRFDSFHFVSAVFDEAGETEHSEVTKKITSGQVKVKNKQFIQISTAYPDPTVPFKQEEDTLLKIMENDDRSGDEQLCLVWCQDLKEELDDPRTWEKSNPLLGLYDQKDLLMNGLLTERNTLQLLGQGDSFLNKNLNLWLTVKSDAYVSLEDYKETTIGGDFDIKGKEVYIGFDASLSSDNTAFGFVFPYEENEQRKYYLMQHSFIPYKLLGSIEGKEKSDGLAYRELAKKGYCTITNDPTGLIDLDQVYDWLLEFVEANQLKVNLFAYDAARTNKLTQLLEENTIWDILNLKQTSMVLSESIKFLQDCFIRKQATHEEDLILERALLNADVEENKGGLVIGKSKRSFKIDVVDALIDAMYQGMYHFEGFTKSDNPYDKLSNEELEEMILTGKMVF